MNLYLIYEKRYLTTNKIIRKASVSNKKKIEEKYKMKWEIGPRDWEKRE